MQKFRQRECFGLATIISRKFAFISSFLIHTVNIVCIASGRGSNVAALLRAIDEHRVAGRVVLVISNNSGAEVLALARDGGIPTLHLSEKQFAQRSDFAATFVDILQAAHADLIVLAGYLRKLPDEVCAAYRGRIINIHPALLPAYGGEGMYGIHVHEAVLASGAKESGATVHYVDEVYDHGNILLHKRVPVVDGDTPETLAARVLECEHEILVEAVKKICFEESEKAEGGRQNS